MDRKPHTREDVAERAVLAWAEHTTGSVRLRPGGHLSVNDERDALLDELVGDLKAVG